MRKEDELLWADADRAAAEFLKRMREGQERSMQEAAAFLNPCLTGDDYHASPQRTGNTTTTVMVIMRQKEGGIRLV